MNAPPSKTSEERVGTSKGALAEQAWTAMQQYFFTHGRPRMLAMWREFDLAPPQMMALSLLDQPKPMGELAAMLHCDSSNITWIVDKLSERGFVERLPAPGDRRVKLVALTAEGIELRDELARRRAVPPPEMLKLSKAELEGLDRIIEKLSPPVD